MNSFYFHPVGQGLFYTGALNNGKYNFVYDCGSETGGDFLKNEIESYAKFLSNQTSKTIDFVLLSHLHRDHINGLQLLLSKCNVNTLYLPYLTHDHELMRLVLANEIFINKNDFDKNRDLFEFIIGFYENADRRDGFPRVRYMGNIENDVQEIIRKYEEGNYKYSLTEDYYHTNDQGYLWHFKFINRCVNDTKIKNLSSKLKNAIESYNKTHTEKVSTVKDLIYQGKLRELKDIYTNVFGTGNRLNLSSTVLIHYPDERMNVYTCLQCPFGCWQNSDITILTGDVEFDDKINATIEQTTKDRFCIFQIPHHGSYNNWNSISYKNKSNVCYFVVPYGFGNKHRHPSGQTIAELQTISEDCKIKHVTQVKGFLYHLN